MQYFPYFIYIAKIITPNKALIKNALTAPTEKQIIAPLIFFPLPAGLPVAFASNIRFASVIISLSRSFPSSSTSRLRIKKASSKISLSVPRSIITFF